VSDEPEDRILAAIEKLRVDVTDDISKFRADVTGGISEFRADVTGDISKFRADLMERMDRLQTRMDSMDDHLTMGLGNSDRVERQANGVADQNRIIGEQLNTLHKLVRRLEGRINGLEEQK
jgi:hypothetical protein